MKKIKQSYPRREKMLALPFDPLGDDEFRRLVSSGLAIPRQQGTTLFVAKWHPGPGPTADEFLVAVKSQGGSLVARHYKGDVNVRVVPATKPSARRAPAAAPARPARK